MAEPAQDRCKVDGIRDAVERLAHAPAEFIPQQQRPDVRAYTHTNVSGDAAVVQGDIHNYYYGPSVDVNGTKYDILLRSLEFPRMDARVRNVATALATTCEWVLSHQNFARWVDRSCALQHHGFLWIKGKPGSGKSTIMKETLTWAQRHWSEEAIVSYFFNARSPEILEKSSLGLYRSLLHQILTVRASTHIPFQERFTSKEKDQQVEDWSETELQNFLLELAGAKELSCINVFIDALDEGNDDDVRRMIGFLEQLTTRAITANAPIRICLSSRHYPHIRIRKGLAIVLEDELSHSLDIQTYVYNELFGADSVWMEELRCRVCKRAAGVFLWVVLVVCVLNKAYDAGKGLRAMLQVLDGIPADLHDVYDSILSSAFRENDEAIRIFQWVLVARRPLTLRELYCIAQQTCSSNDMDDVETLSPRRFDTWLVNCSHGLIESSKGETFGVQFIHETVREYLLGRTTLQHQVRNEQVARILSDHFKEDNCHLVVAENCLRYLLALSRNGLLNEYIVAHWPLSAYASQHWWPHLGKSTTSDQKILELAIELLTNESSLLAWVQLYDIDMDCMRTRLSRKYDPTAPPIYHAASTGLSRLVAGLLEKSHDINAPGGFYGHALQAASVHGYIGVVELLVERGADVNAKGGRYGDALQAACVRDHDLVVQMLLTAGADGHA